MPWQPYKQSTDSSPRASRSPSPSSSSREGRQRRRPSYLDQFDVQADNNIEPDDYSKKKNPSPVTGKLDSNKVTAEKRVKEKSSYKRLITNLQETYPDLTQEEALKGILALRVENSGTLTGMTMLEIMEGVIRLVTTCKEKAKHQTAREESVDADVENSSADEMNQPKDFEQKKSSSNEKTDGLDPEPLNIPVIKSRNMAEPKKDRVCSTDSTEDDSELEDRSYSPDKQKYSPKKKSPRKSTTNIITNYYTKKSPPKLREPRKKLEISVDDIDAEFPKVCRKRKIPSHFSEYALPCSEEETDKIIKSSPKSKPSKKKRESPEINLSETFLNDEITDSPKKSPVKKNIVAQLKSDFGDCFLCGLRFDDTSRIMKMNEKTRESNRSFGDILHIFFKEETFPDIGKNQMEDTESGLLCTMCVSYIEQMDVFQNKLAEVKESIWGVITRKIQVDTVIDLRSDAEKEENSEDKPSPSPSKRGRPRKSPVNCVKEVLSSVKFTTSNKKEVPSLNDTEEIANKLKVLSGIEIKRINTETGEEIDARQLVKKVRSPPKKKMVDLHVSEALFENACEALESELVDDPDPVSNEESQDKDSQPEQLLQPREQSIRGRGRGRGQGRGRGRPPLHQPPSAALVAPPVLQRSRKSLFETSQERRRSGTPLVSPQTSSLSPGAQYTLSDVSLTPSTSSTLPQHNPTLYSVPVIPSFQDAAPAASTPVKADADNLAELSQKKAYRKLVARIRGVHPELGPDETLRGIVNVRAAHQGTLTGMSMTEIITKVRDSVLETAAASSVDSMDEFERMVNAPLLDKKPPTEPTPSFAPAPYKTFELKCQFCSRVFKSTNEIATKKVYDIHMHEHEVENKNIYESLQDDPTNFNDFTPLLKTSNTSQHSIQSLTESPGSEKENVPLKTKPEPDPVRKEASYCKPCHKQFKNAKIYAHHQNSEHDAEKEFEKISKQTI